MTPETPKPKARRGFAAMSPETQKAIASKGGQSAHLKGTAHEWTSATAREAGLKSGRATAERRRNQPTPPEP